MRAGWCCTFALGIWTAACGDPSVPLSSSDAGRFRDDASVRVDASVRDDASAREDVGMADREGPAVLSTTPANGASEVGRNATITVRFDEAIDPSSVTAATFLVEGAPGTLTVEGAVVIFSPASLFAPAATQRVRLTTGITDLAGNALGSEYSFAFTTAREGALDVTPPVIVATSPSDGAIDVRVDTSVDVFFSEDIDPASVTSATLAVAGVAGSVSVSGSTAVFTPTAPLAPGTEYRVDIGSSIADRAGNTLGAAASIGFTTGRGGSGGRWIGDPVSLASGVYSTIAGSGRTVHFARGAGGDISYRRSEDEGVTWTSDVTIGTGWLYLEDPMVADGNDVYIAYVNDTVARRDFFGTRNCGDIFFRFSRDNGRTWSSVARLTTAQGVFRLSMAVSGSTVHLVWMDLRRETTWDVYYRRSTDRGVTWETEQRLVTGEGPIGAERPQLAVSGELVHVVWMDGRHRLPPCRIEGGTILPECTELYYKRSLDGGVTWGADIRMTRDMGYAGRPEVAATGDITLITYDSGPVGGGGTVDEYLFRSTDRGATFGAPIRLTDGAGDESHSYLIGGTTSHLVWSGEGVRYRISRDSGASWGAEELVGASGETAPLLAITDNHVHSIWWDSATGTILYRRRTLSD